MMLGCVSKGARLSCLAQQKKTLRLCTCCGDVVQAVDGGGKDGQSQMVPSFARQDSRGRVSPRESGYFWCFRLFLTGLPAFDPSFAASLTIWRNARTSALSGRCRG